MLALANATLFSCTTDSLTETDETYMEQSTEGDDGEVVSPPKG